MFNNPISKALIGTLMKGKIKKIANSDQKLGKEIRTMGEIMKDIDQTIEEDPELKDRLYKELGLK